MSETVKHTPGPWFVGSKFVVGPRDDSDTQSFGMVIGVADVYGDNREQDARLIAAAPEMLEALRNALATGLPDVVANAVRAAIAKAEGRNG